MKEVNKERKSTMRRDRIKEKIVHAKMIKGLRNRRLSEAHYIPVDDALS